MVTALLQKGEEEDARDVLVSLNEIAETEPLLFKPHFQQHAVVLLEVANNGDFDSETRQGALELLITVVEGKPALIRKDRVLLPKLCTTLLGMLLAIEDTEQWHAAVEEQDLDDGALRGAVCLLAQGLLIGLHFLRRGQNRYQQ